MADSASTSITTTTAPLPSTSKSTPQPGDGAYLASQPSQSQPSNRQGGSGSSTARRGRGHNHHGTSRPQPGDGAYLASLNQQGSDVVVIEEIDNRSQPQPSRSRRRSLQTPSLRRFEDGTTHHRSGSVEKTGAQRSKGGQRSRDQRNARQHRAAVGHAENMAENLANGVGHVDEGLETSMGLKKLDPSSPAFTPGRAEGPASGTASGTASGAVTGTEGEGEGGQGQGNRRNGRQKKPRGKGGRHGENDQNGSDDQPTSAPAPPTPVKAVSSRRAAFDKQTRLTDATPAAPRKATNGVVDQLSEYRAGHARAEREKEADDLNSRLTRGLSRKPFLECPICFNPILPSQQIWSCLPPSRPFQPPILTSGPTSLSDAELAALSTSYYSACYTPFHSRCIRDWANRSLHEDAERAAANDQVGQVPTWRCPGCQKKREDKVGGYRCFCGRLGNPGSGGGSGQSGSGNAGGSGQTSGMPHSCNDACARPRANCEHACPLHCHPGPCPPCQVALVVPCPSHHTALTVKCAATRVTSGTVCDEPCAKPLGCGNRAHACPLPCHFGPCPPCDEVETVRCYCGDEDKVVPCGWGSKDEKICLSENGAERWQGRFKCDRPCGRLYDCAVHSCKEKCHPHPIHPQHCPTSPDQITHCPCGSTPLTLLPGYPQRKTCTDRVPTCKQPCTKLRACGHECPRTCHEGPCPTCTEEVVRPCRCGESMVVLPCEEVERAAAAAAAAGSNAAAEGVGEVLCERVCKALRNCGRHECGRVCCPLSYRAKGKNKGKAAHELLDGDDDLHTCPLVCGKMLSCGLHSCPKPDHKGLCGKCLQASYDELICHCGHTVVYPPVACGTTINCPYTCARDPPACGHPKTQHSCHENPNCPPCPYLTTKPCACGKEPAVKNVRCSQSLVSCGQACGKQLACGYHKCDKPCHRPGECGDCTQQCGKPKRACGHPCTSACHAPARCPESDACQAIVTQSCACGHLQSRTSCGASTASPTSREQVKLKCNSECLVRQRNARLADALGIKQAESRGQVEWSTDLKSWAEGPNSPFVKTVEGAFKDFINGTRQTTILPHMPLAKRTFVIALAEVYRLSTDLIDAEPNRSVQIRRRPDSRIPNPLLSAAAPPKTGPPAGPSVTLTNLRSSGPWGKPSGVGSGTSSQPSTRPVTPATTSGGTAPSSPWSARLAPASTARTNQASYTPTVSPAGSARPLTPVSASTPEPGSIQAQAHHDAVQQQVGDDGDDWDKSGDEAE